MWPFRRGSGERLWLAEATAGALETAARAPDIDEILRFWAKEISAALRPAQIALFVLEGGRWLRILPEGQSTDVPFIADTALASALAALGPVRVETQPRRGPQTVLVRFNASSGWRGVLALWGRGGSFRRRVRLSSEVALAIGRTLTALRRAELAHEQAIAEERTRWATELHDGHLQTLSSAKMHSEVCLTLQRQHQEVCIAFDPNSAGHLETELARLHDLLGATIREARQYLLELRSPPVSAEQFLPWLHSYADDFERETGVKVEVRVEGEDTLPQSQVEEGTRVIREALTNVRKHARAAHVRIAVAFSEHHTSISVSDDGVGFDVQKTMEQVLESSHNGLIGSRYRTESIGGEMRLRSEVGKGTTLLFRLPKGGRRATADIHRPSQPARASQAIRSKAIPAPAVFRDATVRSSIRSAFTETAAPWDLDDDSSGGRTRRPS
jgi:signal transduction histidine kinase